MELHWPQKPDSNLFSRQMALHLDLTHLRCSEILLEVGLVVSQAALASFGLWSSQAATRTVAW